MLFADLGPLLLIIDVHLVVAVHHVVIFLHDFSFLLYCF